MHRKPTPLFKVGAILVAPDVHISPPLTEALKFFDKMVASLVESTKAFVRWMCVFRGPLTHSFPPLLTLRCDALSLHP